VEAALRETGMTVEEMAERLDYKSLKRAMYGEIPLPESKRRHITDLVELARMGKSSSPILGEQDLGLVEESGPRSALRRFRERSRLELTELAKLTRYSVGVLTALEQGSARLTERQADALAKALKLTDEEKEFLLSNSEQSSTGDVLENTIGARPDVESPRGMVSRYIPVISWAQAGSLESLAPDDLYGYQGRLAVAVKDPSAIAIPIKGDSMEPKFSDGDLAIVYPSRQPQTGNLVVTKLRDGTVLFKRFHMLGEGRYQFTSYNEVYPPLTVNEGDVQWIYPVALTQKIHL
jgi:phage repressor protein C with HTH and peptisase S24 domain